MTSITYLKSSIRTVSTLEKEINRQVYVNASVDLSKQTQNQKDFQETGSKKYG
jgi:hypothetical protein